MKTLVLTLLILPIFGCSSTTKNSISGTWVKLNSHLVLELNEKDGKISGHGQYYTCVMTNNGQLKISGNRNKENVKLILKTNDYSTICKYKLVPEYKLTMVDINGNNEKSYLFDSECLISVEKKNTTLYPLILIRPEAKKKFTDKFGGKEKK